ncbi:MAG: type II toxin-antitoxin system HicB family antitoxin [Bacteroidetes bacterium]|nr:type II toxin-antitoxin system HicB family antitoxin [Bacteroidota bacterium]
MKKVISVHIFKGEKYFVAECIDLPIVTQGKTLDELVKNLKEAFELHLENESLESLDITPNPTVIANVELDNLIYA